MAARSATTASRSVASGAVAEFSSRARASSPCTIRPRRSTSPTASSRLSWARIEVRLEVLQPQPQRGQRGLELVGGLGGERPLHLEQILLPGRGAGERVGQAPEFGRALGGGGRRLEAAVGEFGGGALQGPYGPGDPVGEREGDGGDGHEHAQALAVIMMMGTWSAAAAPGTTRERAGRGGAHGPPPSSTRARHTSCTGVDVASLSWRRTAVVTSMAGAERGTFLNRPLARRCPAATDGAPRVRADRSADGSHGPAPQREGTPCHATSKPDSRGPRTPT